MTKPTVPTKKNPVLIVTTGHKERYEHVKLAHEYAAELGAAYIQRKDRSLEMLRHDTGADIVLVCTDKAKLSIGDADFFFHPSMANTRIKRLRKGENDIVIDRTGARPGDTVLDCTLGLGSDSIVFAHVVGDSGRVIGTEASPIIATLVRRGLQELVSDIKEVTAAMRRVEVVCADHLTYLRSLPDKSVDIVYFDPMFRKTVEDSVPIEPLRILGDDSPLTEEAIQEAKRVCRRRIVLKERWYSQEFARLGFQLPAKRASGSVHYGWIDVEGGTDA
ncbi:MAG TPA: class I SAM-dependent methyltransferase [Bacilli bacterium]|nr:class I SAM-dependent methyltransferase [Bacilli bacterium]